MAVVAKPCNECGGPKPEGQGRKLCDDCRLAAAERKRELGRIRGRADYQRNRAARIVRNRKWAVANADRVRENKRRWYEERKRNGLDLAQRLRKYGLTPEEYQSLCDKQNGRCAICGGRESRRLAVDHCHETGEIRGLLCSGCNGAKLGRLGHDIERIETRAAELEAKAALHRRAAEYLRNPPARGVL